MTYESRRIHYFTEEGRINFSDTLKLVKAYVRSSDINHIVIFSQNGDSALKLKRALPSAQITAVTFPANPLQDTPESGEPSTTLVDPQFRAQLREQGIGVAIGPLPLSGIIIPRVEDPKLAGISYALRLFGGGMNLCVQAATIATDAGYLQVGEQAIVMSADTAIVVKASTSSLMFHTRVGLQIEHIICKPARFTITRETPLTNRKEER